MAKINRQIRLRSLFIFTALFATSLSLVLLDSDGPKTIGLLALGSLIGGAIGFAVAGSTGYVFGAIIGYMAVIPPDAYLVL